MAVQEVVDELTRRLTCARPKPLSKSKQIFIKTKRDYYERIANAKQEGKPLAWMSFAVPTEILYCMDVVPFIVEQYGIQFLAMGKGYDYLELGAGAGFSKEACTAHLYTAGMMLDETSLPPPDLILCTSMPCDSGLMMFEFAEQLYKPPTFYLDYPYRYYAEEAVQYYKKQLEDMVAFLEEITHKPLDLDRLREALSYSYKAQHYYVLVHELRKSIPAPMGGKEALSSLGIWTCAPGLPEMEEYYKAQYEEVKERVERGEGVVPQERHRMAWWGTYPCFDMGLIDWIEKEYGAVIVWDLHNLVGAKEMIDLKDPLLAIAQRSMDWCATRICGPVGHAYHEIIQACRDFSVDSAIFYTSLGCKHTASLNRLLRDGVKREIGIPTLILDGGMLDPAEVPIYEIKNKIHDYFTMIEHRE